MNYSEYLYEIDQKAKAVKASQKFKSGDLVLINLPAGMPHKLSSITGQHPTCLCCAPVSTHACGTGAP